MLKIENLVKSYKKGVPVVKGINLNIEKGDIFAFIGHNGAGKTTVIKCVVGITDFESGEIFVDEKNIKTQPLDCKNVFAYIPDNPDIYDFMSGIDYLNFICDIFQIPAETRKTEIEKFAKKFEIYDDLNKKVSEFSHGMKQKLVIISAMIRKPKLLILDEPFVGLDPMATIELKKMFKEFCKEGGSIFFSTHVLEVAEKLCNKVAIIKNGKIVASGTMEEVKGSGSLEDAFVAEAKNE